MELNKVLLYSESIAASAGFYRNLGAEILNQTEDELTVKIGQFVLWFFDQSKVKFPLPEGKKGTGIFFYVWVESVDGKHSELIAAGLTPSSEPTDQEWGNREFAIKDPDGYRLVFYKEI